MIDTSFLKQLDRLSLVINKRITSSYVGERLSSYQGEGVVFKDYVIYAPGDDFRSIDWKVYARLNKLFVKRYEEERNLTVHIIVDFSASMGFGSGKTKKSEYASMLALGFAYMALKNNERFVLSTFAEHLEFLRPKRGRAQLASMLERLNSTKPSGTSKFQESLTQYKKLINTKSYVVIISDFLYPPEEIGVILNRFHKHDVRLLQVLDPIESDFELDGDFKFRDAETASQMRAYVNPSFRRTYLDQLHQHQNEIRKLCDETNSFFYPVSTDKEIFDVFYEILQPNGHARHIG